jgi:hypothetical protein
MLDYCARRLEREVGPNSQALEAEVRRLSSKAWALWTQQAQTTERTREGGLFQGVPQRPRRLERTPWLQWWALVDSNHRPRPYQGRALTTC